MQEITLYADRGNAEAIGDMLMEAGASSYTTQDADADTPSESPLFGEPGLEPKVQAWNRSLLTVLANDAVDTLRIERTQFGCFYTDGLCVVATHQEDFGGAVLAGMCTYTFDGDFLVGQ